MTELRDVDQAHPILPEPHTIDATYRWIKRSLRLTNARLSRTIAKSRGAPWQHTIGNPPDRDPVRPT